MRFTAEEAYDLQGTEDAIFIDQYAAAKICRDHDATLGEYFVGNVQPVNHEWPTSIDAADLLMWLGY